MRMVGRRLWKHATDGEGSAYSQLQAEEQPRKVEFEHEGSDDVFHGQCCICFDSDCPLRRIHGESGSCGGVICGECALQYVRSGVANGTVGRGLRCPLVDCRAPIPVGVIEDVCASEPELLEKYHERLDAHATLEASRDRRLRRWAPSVEDLLSEFQFSAWRHGKDLRRCPGCSSVIEKNGGCPHMTCSKCSHEFYWCCCQDYKGKHNEILCALGLIYYNPSVWWGPVTPIRCLTKTVAYTSGLSLVTVGVPAYLLIKNTYKLYKESPVKRYYRRRAQRRAAARIRAAQEQRNRDRQYLAERELQCLHAVLAQWWDRGGAEPYSVYNKSTLDVFRTWASAPREKISCGVCDGGEVAFSRPLDAILHIHDVHRGHWEHHPAALYRMVSVAAKTQGDILLTRYFTPPSPLLEAMEISFIAVEEAKESSDGLPSGTTDGSSAQSTSPTVTRCSEGLESGITPEFPISYLNLEAVRDFRRRYAKEISQWKTITATQVCSCGLVFESLEALAEHALFACTSGDPLSSSARSVGRCKVAISPGRLCECITCIDGEDTDLCLGCSHPRILHDHNAEAGA